jgi:hypothetical protein
MNIMCLKSFSSDECLINAIELDYSVYKKNWTFQIQIGYNSIVVIWQLYNCFESMVG